MSDLRSPVYLNSAKVQTFSASSIGALKEILSARRGQVSNPDEQLEEHKRLTIEAAEKIGREQGHAAGFLQGYEDGKNLGRQESKDEAAATIARQLDEFLVGLEQISQNLQIRVEAWFVASEEQMTDLAMSAVRKVLAAELSISRQSALEIVKDALRDVTHSRHARIRINLLDAPLLSEHRQEIMTAAGNLRDIEFVSDPSIPAGCVIETEGGVVDATTETKLTLLENEVKLAS